ncbi:hypothetical protein D3C76_1516600 [compost metagenome]
MFPGWKQQLPQRQVRWQDRSTPDQGKALPVNLLQFFELKTYYVLLRAMVGSFPDAEQPA